MIRVVAGIIGLIFMLLNVTLIIFQLSALKKPEEAEVNNGTTANH
jgi:hypothetical protein